MFQGSVDGLRGGLSLISLNGEMKRGIDNGRYNMICGVDVYNRAVCEWQEQFESEYSIQ